MWLIEMQLEMHPLVRANQRSPVASRWLRLVKVELLSTRLLGLGSDLLSRVAIVSSVRAALPQHIRRARLFR